MSVESAKAKLDAQPGDPATGYISKADHQDSYTELVDDTALTGATTAEALTISGTLNGRDPDNLVAGPASATDNALVRFDGTGGKTVQNSGITVNDSGNLAASGRITINSGVSSYGLLVVDSAVEADAMVHLRKGGTPRWVVKKNSDPESGSSAGANFEVVRTLDTDVEHVAMSIARATGKTTLGSVGATAGLELGSSGPRVMSGTGSPEGVVTAPVGSMWTDEAATTGAIKWIKASGTGNTGWVVEYGDTGSRNMSAVGLSNGWTTSGFTLQRVGKTVHLTIGANNSAASADTIYTLPTGFRPVGYIYFATVTNTSDDLARFYMEPSGALVAWPRSAMTGATLYATATFITNNAWPSSLPGTAA